MWVNQIRPLLQSDDIYHQLLCTPQTHTLKNNWYPSFIDGAHPLNVFTISYSTQPCILKSMVKFNISLVLQLTWTDNHMTASASRRCSLCSFSAVIPFSYLRIDDCLSCGSSLSLTSERSIGFHLFRPAQICHMVRNMKRDPYEVRHFHRRFHPCIDHNMFKSRLILLLIFQYDANTLTYCDLYHESYLKI